MEEGWQHYVRQGGGVLALEICAFWVFGLQVGCHAVLLADLSRALGLSPGPLGLALLAGAASSVVVMSSLGWTADWLGRKAFLLVVVCVSGCGIVGLAVADSFATLILVMVVVFPAAGLYDVGINAVAVDLEQATRSRYMPFLHAAYSGGAVVGALGAGVLLSVGVGYRLIYLLLLVPLAAVAMTFASTQLPPPGGAHGEAPSEGITDTSAGNGRWDLYRRAPLLLVAAIAAFGLLAEGEMENWSGIYLRHSVGLPPLSGGFGVTVFYGAMTVGRLATGWVVNRVGNQHTLLAAGLLVAFGMALALATTAPSLVIVGLLLVGLALAAIVPLALSVAGDLVPERAGAAISVVTTFGYGGFLLGPPLIGGLAALVGLRAALGVIAFAGFTISILSMRLRAHEEKSMTS
ncbi:MAG: MFS transporter [Actinomycetota bacterium]|nr:MFS transporter [Actinomycetota bacterium]